ncbi:site-specific recombinase [soil metagenome]
MRIRELLEKIQSEENADPSILIDLINELGIHSGNSTSTTKKIIELTTLLLQEPKLATALRRFLIDLYSSYNPLTFYTETGIFTGHGFFTEIFQRLKFKILPPLEEPENTQFLIRKIFYNKSDFRNIENIDETVWINFINAIGINADASFWDQKNLNFLLNAMMVLSQRVTAIGLEPEVLNKLPQTEDLQSPFFGLYKEVQQYVHYFKEDPSYINRNDEDYRQILVMCSQCRESINELHKHKDKYGISIQLAYLMLRLEQHIVRLTVILNLIELRDKDLFTEQLLLFTKESIQAENKRFSIRKHINDNLSLIAYKITEHTSHKGEHYSASNWKEYNAMFRGALGGGFIVSFLVILKVFVHHAEFPAFWEALLYSLIYAVGFVLIHFLHFTLATKQPALTANTIAASIDDQVTVDKSMLKTVKLISEISRAQFISLIGNIIVVLPFTFLLGWIYFSVMGSNLTTPEESHEMMQSLHPWETGSLFYAAIAGVFLMMGGLIAGYYDNKVIYDRIPERIRQHPFLIKIFSENRLHKIGSYLKNNLGVILGNVYLGFFLGFAGMFGKLLGLPFDVRHVTLSTGVFGLSLQGSNFPIDSNLLIEVSLSLILMGLINLFVSFGSAIYIAVRSRSLNVKRMKNLLFSLRAYFRAMPFSFIFPTRSESIEVDKENI